MKELGKILAVASVFLLPFVVSCEKGNVERSTGAVLQLSVEVEPSELLEETKGQYYEDIYFIDGESFGLCVLESGTTSPFQDDYDNIKVVFEGGEWWYYIGNEEPVKSLTITSRADRKKADIFAYAPYCEDDDFDPSAIPVRVTDDVDFMYDKNNVDPSHIGIDPSKKTKIELVIQFYHAMSRVRFKIRLENSGSDQRWDYVELRKSTGPTPLYTDGTFDVTTNTFSMDSTAASVRVNCNGLQLSSSHADSVEFVVFPHPVEYVDSSYSVVFGIDGIPYEYAITNDDLKHKNSDKPLTRSYIYTLNFTYYNYVHFNGLVLGQLSDGGSFNYTLQY